jgi:hypothetical protein
MKALLKTFFENIEDNSDSNNNERDEIEIHFEQPSILLNHRRFFCDKFLFDALQKPTRILFVTIMSKHTINEIKSLNLRGNLNVNELRVLTLKCSKKVDQIAEYLSNHFDEKPVESVTSQISTALKEWKKLSEQHNTKVFVREYDSIPTMQGFIVEGQYALVELLTFHSQPNQRAAILAKKIENPELYELFSTAFENLWLASENG